MLKRGQIIRAPKDADLVMLREMKKQGLGNVFGIRGGSEFMILQALVGQAGIEQGDYMAVRPGWTTFYLIPKAMAEGWDLEVDPAQEDERRTLDALQVIETELTTARTGPPRADGAPPAREVMLRYHHWTGLFEVEGVTDDTRFTRAKRDRLASALRWYADQNDRPARSPEHRGLTERCEKAEQVLAALRAELDKARSDLEKTRSTLSDERQKAASAIEAAAIGEAVIDALNGEEVSDFMSSFGPVSTAQNLKLTCDLLQGDVIAQRRVIAEACAVLGVTDDDEADWPKLPAACAAMAADLKEARLTIAAEQGKPEGAPSLHWRCWDDQWERIDSAGRVTAIAERGGRLQIREQDDGLTVWSITEHGTARAAMIFADTKLEQR